MLIKNTLTDRLEEFKPIKKGKVGMYHCGPTVYNPAHIGNLRPYVFADLMRRIFEYKKFKVKQVINITDVGHLVSDEDTGEDKIEQAAKSKGIKAKQITKEITDLFMRDLKSLNIEIKKIKFPKATEYIDKQIKLIQKLEKKGYTYKIDDGIYFDTSKFADYGILGKINLEKLKQGARVEFNLQKKNASDFALWKFSNPNEKREQEWSSPWGVGFPGWHIECSTMSADLLGQPFDIHTGGIDHISIHHNNEIAQSVCANDCPLSNYWMHINFITINNQKISKSLGNNILLSQLKIWPESYRYWLLTSHYSSLLNFTDESVSASETAFKKLLKSFIKVKVGKVEQKYVTLALTCLEKDFDSAGAIATIWEMMKDKTLSLENKFATVLEIDKILGLNIKNLVKQISKQNLAQKIPNEIIEMARERQTARSQKDWGKSDEIRAKIEALGFKIKDLGDEFEIEPLD